MEVKEGGHMAEHKGVFIAPTKESNRYPLFDLATGALDT
jgi:hypothetical protein